MLRTCTHQRRRYSYAMTKRELEKTMRTSVPALYFVSSLSRHEFYRKQTNNLCKFAHFTQEVDTSVTDFYSFLITHLHF
jgi:hypothetical protein